MNSRSRVLDSIAHKNTDRLPAAYGAERKVTDALKKHLGITEDEELMQFLGIDFRGIPCNYYIPGTGPDAEGYIRSMWGERKREHDLGDGKPCFIAPFTEESTLADVDAHDWPDPSVLDYSQVRATCKKWYGSYATYGAPWSPFFHEVGWMIGQENFYTWMGSKPEVAEAIITKVVDFEVEATRRFLEACDGMLDIAYFGNDFGTQRGLFISPAMWQRFIRPSLKRFYDVAHEFGCQVMQHSCGSIRQLIPWFIEDGVDILDPVQTACDGMGLPSLVQDFGGRISFHGGMDTQVLLPNASSQEVRSTVRQYRDLMLKRGGYTLCGSQAYMTDIPLENILAIYDENKKAS
ncbi:MAG: hypothetical protein HQL31_13965 [Planctomycetes bacterium]|nr:hypothetical protein [Planctomycetota bacterium]